MFDHIHFGGLKPQMVIPGYYSLCTNRPMASQLFLEDDSQICASFPALPCQTNRGCSIGPTNLSLPGCPQPYHLSNLGLVCRPSYLSRRVQRADLQSRLFSCALQPVSRRIPGPAGSVAFSTQAVGLRGQPNDAANVDFLKRTWVSALELLDLRDFDGTCNRIKRNTDRASFQAG